ncbi:MAG TPA: hypothetical protein EYH06_05430 [Chromatiales bacterium]|nr:hypothetical protein [Thiotrichales bacterium]HIP68019.1 hypothetical protein [Chromatiales bacterium]
MFKNNLLPFYLLFSVLVLNAQVLATSSAELDEFLNQADMHIASSNYEAARNSIDSAIKTAPASSRAYQKLAALQIIKLEYANSIPNFQKAIGLDEKNAGAFLGLGFAYLHMGRYGPARAALLEAETLLPARKQEIHQVVIWLDKRSGMSEPQESTYLSIPEAVKAVAEHSKK